MLTLKHYADLVPWALHLEPSALCLVLLALQLAPCILHLALYTSVLLCFFYIYITAPHQPTTNTLHIIMLHKWTSTGYTYTTEITLFYAPNHTIFFLSFPTLLELSLLMRMKLCPKHLLSFILNLVPWHLSHSRDLICGSPSAMNLALYLDPLLTNCTFVINILCGDYVQLSMDHGYLCTS